MKKITFMLALLVLIFTSVQSAFATDEKWENEKIVSVSAAVDGLENLKDGYYLLRNVGRKTFLRENDNKGLYLWNATNGSDELATIQTKFVNTTDYMSSVVYVRKINNSHQYTIQFMSGQYIGTSLPNGGAASSNATAGDVEIAALGSSQFTFRPTGSNWSNGNGAGGYTEGTFTGWGTTKPNKDGNGAYQFFPVTLENHITVTWTVKNGDTTFDTFTTVTTSGQNITTLPALPEMSFYYSNATLVAPTNNVVSTDNCNFTINATKAATPFEASTAEDPIWYTIKFRKDNTKTLIHVLNTDNSIGTTRTLSADFCNQYAHYNTFEGALWAFVEDRFGVKLLNKQTGKYVTCSAPNSTQAKLNTDGTIFIVKTNSTGDFSLQIPGASNAHIGDHANNTLGTWNNGDSQNDGGSNFTITKVDGNENILAVAKATLKDPISNDKLIAYTSANLAKYATQIDAVTTVAGMDEVNKTIATSAFIPEEGVYYRIKNCNLSDTQKAYISAENIFVGTDGELSTAYYAHTDMDRVIRRATASGKFISQLWSVVANEDGTCKIVNANTGCRMSTYVSTGIDMPIDKTAGGNYSVKAVPTATFNGNDGSTMLQLNIDNQRINAYQGDANDIICDYGGNHDNDQGNYWQFIKVTEVPVTISAANYATVAYPFAVQVPANSGITAYSVSEVNGGYLILNEITDGIIPAGQGAILYHEGETTANLTITTTSKTLADNKLVGATAKRIGFEGNDTYVLALNSENKAAFLKSELTTVPANKAYVLASTLPSTEAAATALNFNFGQVTAINAAQTNTKNNVEYYDLNGRRVLYPANGIFVTNTGKKVFIK